MSIRSRLMLGWIILGGLALLGGPPVLAGATQETYICGVVDDMSNLQCLTFNCSDVCPNSTADRCDVLPGGGSLLTCYGEH